MGGYDFRHVHPAVEERVLRPLNVDFARPPRWPVSVLWALVAAGVVCAIWLGTAQARQWIYLSQARDDVAALRERTASAAAARASFAASAAEPPAYAADARHWSKLGTVGVDGVLRSIEAAQVVGAKLISLDVDGDTQRVELQLDVTGADVASAYVQALNAGLVTPLWTLARLQTQGTTQTAIIHGQIVATQ